MPKTIQKGFTLIELLIVVGIISILAGVTLSVINVEGQRNRAEDSIRLANVEKLVLGLKAYKVVESTWPLDANADGSPMDDTMISDYISGWPDGEPTTDTVYSYWSNGTEMGLVVLTDRATAFKYRSEWTKIQECNNVNLDVTPSNINCTVVN